MAECKDCIHYCVCSPYTAPSETYPEVGGCGCFKPYADFLPKEFLIRKEDEAYELGYAEGKTEVAREIFEEIERFLYMHFRVCKEEIGNDDTKYFEGRLELNTQMQDFIAELKKKYTEGKDD